jgi:hypothetical protein
LQTRFTCFTSTKVQILTPEELRDITTDFAHEDVANTLWALATLGQTPGPQVMQALSY